MSEAAAFLRVINDHPEDDVARLVYADWLDEHGDSDRAEFIRGQCRLAGMEEWHDGYAELNARCELLLRTHLEKWMPPVAEIREGAPDWMRRQYEFRRGFLDCLQMQPDHFMERWPRLFELTPVRRIEIQCYPVDLPPHFWSCEGLAYLQRLWVYPSWDSVAHLTPALSSPDWQLTDLGVRSDFMPDVAKAVANSPSARNLERLEINARDPGISVWQELCNADSLCNLKRFGFRSRLPLSAFIDPRKVANPAWFSNLERLELVGTPRREPFELPGVRPLLSGGPLRGLVLEGCGFANSEPSLLRAMPPGSLEHFDLGSGCGISRKVLRALIQSPGLARLCSLALGGNGNAAMTYLRDAPMRDSLRVLRLSGCRPSGILALAAVGCPRLATLDIGIADAERDDPAGLASAIDAILDPNNFPRLVSLKLRARACPLPGALRRLVENPAVARLRELRLFFHPDPNELRSLLTSGSLDALDRLQLPEHFLDANDSWIPDAVDRAREECKKRAAALQDRFGPRYDPLQR